MLRWSFRLALFHTDGSPLRLDQLEQGGQWGLQSLQCPQSNSVRPFTPAPLSEPSQLCHLRKAETLNYSFGDFRASRQRDLGWIKWLCYVMCLKYQLEAHYSKTLSDLIGQSRLHALISVTLGLLSFLLLFLTTYNVSSVELCMFCPNTDPYKIHSFLTLSQVSLKFVCFF